MQPAGHVGHQVGPRTKTVGDSSNNNDNFSAKWVLILSALQLASGILSILLQIVAIIIEASLAEIGSGIWCGIFFILAGSCGICAARSKKRSLIKTLMGLSIIAAVMTIPVHMCASFGLSLEPYHDVTITQGVKRPILYLLVFVGWFEKFIAIISASLCCHGNGCCTCCMNQKTVMTIQGQAVQFMFQPGGQSAHVVMTQGQLGDIYQQQTGGHQAQGQIIGSQGFQNPAMEASLGDQAQRQITGPQWFQNQAMEATPADNGSYTRGRSQDKTLI